MSFEESASISLIITYLLSSMAALMELSHQNVRLVAVMRLLMGGRSEHPVLRRGAHPVNRSRRIRTRS
jgi:hypothetical protein